MIYLYKIYKFTQKYGTKKLPDEEQIRLFNDRDNPESFDKLFYSFLPMVLHIVNKISFHRKLENVDDLYQVACMAVIQSIMGKYKPTGKFSACVFFNIKNSLRDYINRDVTVRKNECGQSKFGDVELIHLDAYDNTDWLIKSESSSSESSEDFTELNTALEQLTTEEKLTIQEWFWDQKRHYKEFTKTFKNWNDVGNYVLRTATKIKNKMGYGRVNGKFVRREIC